VFDGGVLNIDACQSTSSGGGNRNRWTPGAASYIEQFALGTIVDKLDNFALFAK
jgi:hypothetical protein